MKKVTVWLDEKYAGVLTVTAVGHAAAEESVAVAGTALEDADVIIIRPGGDIRYEKEGNYPSGPTGRFPEASRGRLALREGEAGETDAVAVVHGRWETNNDPEEIVKDFSCSVCEELLCDFDTYALTPGKNCFYYCPNCGAKMDGGNDDRDN